MENKDSYLKRCLEIVSFWLEVEERIASENMLPTSSSDCEHYITTLVYMPRHFICTSVLINIGISI